MPFCFSLTSQPSLVYELSLPPPPHHHHRHDHRSSHYTPGTSEAWAHLTMESTIIPTTEMKRLRHKQVQSWVGIIQGVSEIKHGIPTQSCSRHRGRAFKSLLIALNHQDTTWLMPLPLPSLCSDLFLRGDSRPTISSTTAVPSTPIPHSLFHFFFPVDIPCITFQHPV